MRILKKSGAITAVVALTALACAASASADTGILEADSPSAITCDFTFTHTGTFPGTVTASGFMPNPITCPGLGFSPVVTMFGSTTNAVTVVNGYVGLLQCFYQLNRASPGTWSGTVSNQTAQFLNKTLLPSGALCSLFPSIHVTRADFFLY